MKLVSCVNDYILECEIKKYTPRTIRSYKNTLSLFCRFCLEEAKIEDMDDLTPGTIKLFMNFFMKKGRKGTYINGMLKVIKSFIQWSYDEYNLGFNTRNGKFKWCKEEKPVITTFSGEQVKKMLDTCTGYDYLNLRDLTILTMCFETGIRCLELCQLKTSDIHDDYIMINNGKNQKSRVVPITLPLKKAMIRYNRARESYFALKNTDNNYFLSFHGKMLTNSAVEHIFKKRGQGIEEIRVSPHTARHFFAQTQLKMGTDIYTISRLLGHENIRITQTYLNSLTNEELIKNNKNRSVLMFL